MEPTDEYGLPEAQPEKRKRGRPKGSRNKPPETILTRDRLESLYNKVNPYLTPEQKRYTREILDGKREVDVHYEMQLLIRQLSIIFSEACIYFWNEKKVNRDLAMFADSLRQALKDLNEMNRQAAKEAEQNKEDDLVRITERGSALERLKALPGFDTPE